MERQPISSSNIMSAGYDPATQTLEIEFKNSDIFRFGDHTSRNLFN